MTPKKNAATETAPRRRSTGSRAGVARKEVILKAAAQVFAEKGFAAATVRDIADEADMLSGSLYYYFDSKESMIQEIVVGYLTPLVGVYANALEGLTTSLEKIEAMVSVGLASLVGNREELMIVHNEWAHVRHLAPIAELQRAVDALWMEVITEGVESGEIRGDYPAKLVYRTIMGGLESVIRWFDPEGPSSLEMITKLQVDLLFDGLRARA